MRKILDTTCGEASFLVTDGSGNGAGVGAYAGVGAGVGAEYQDGVLSGTIGVGAGPGVEIHYSVNAAGAVNGTVEAGAAGYTYTQEGVDAAISGAGQVIDTVDDVVNDVFGSVGDALGDIWGSICFFC